MHQLTLSVLAVLAVHAYGQWVGGTCKPGSTWIEGKFKMECYSNGQIIGYQGVACVPSGKLGDPEYFPGQTWTNDNFEFQCHQNPNNGIGYKIIGCLTPTKQKVSAGSSLAVPGSGIYRCVKKDDGSVSREIDSGCVQNGKLYSYGTQWTENNVKYNCGYFDNKYQVTTVNTPQPQPQPKPQPQPQPQPGGQLCKPGSVWIQNKFKMECYSNGLVVGYQPVACVPSGKLGDAEYFPGQTWVDGSFKMRCEQTANGGISFNIVACYTHTKQELAVGTTLAVPTKGVYTCTRKADGQVWIDLSQGCIHQGKLVEYGKQWNENNSQITCLYNDDKYEVKATACLTNEKAVVNVNTYKQIGDQYFKCVLNQQNALKAEFMQMRTG